ncbi:MAG: hypothetical protein RAO75_08525 [Candidatus Chlorobium antarcticum]|nr:hypothetical protein [Candidatus Chlorobium antarcticum]
MSLDVIGEFVSAFFPEIYLDASFCLTIRPNVGCLFFGTDYWWIYDLEFFSYSVRLVKAFPSIAYYRAAASSSFDRVQFPVRERCSSENQLRFSC